MKKNEREASLAQISYMFQDNALFDSMTVYDNVALPLRETTNLGKAEIDRRVMTRIEQMELNDAAFKYPSELSGGMQKRAALARALVTDPRIVLFDEPTTGQDPVRENAILSMVAENRKKFDRDAVFCVNDLCALGFMNEAEKHGFRAGKDFALAGIDDMAFSSMNRISLTTVRQPYDSIAEKAFRMLCSLMNGETPPKKKIVLPQSLKIRNTTKDFKP
ncbi:MAG: putative ABC transporter ATP-binding protein [Lentisphaerae bacterium ADurb.Bin242]|nr:MAG: putative ABC transporter ATP-binding protein [Lentisphaerae bacterium ADurb.Bin242]